MKPAPAPAPSAFRMPSVTVPAPAAAAPPAVRARTNTSLDFGDDDDAHDPYADVAFPDADLDFKRPASSAASAVSKQQQNPPALPPRGPSPSPRASAPAPVAAVSAASLPAPAPHAFALPAPASASSEPEKSILSSYLSKKSPRGMLGMHPWQQRYFCLYADRIVYAEEAGAAQQSGTIAIAAITDHYHLVRGFVSSSFHFGMVIARCLSIFVRVCTDLALCFIISFGRSLVYPDHLLIVPHKSTTASAQEDKSYFNIVCGTARTYELQADSLTLAMAWVHHLNKLRKALRQRQMLAEEEKPTVNPAPPAVAIAAAAATVAPVTASPLDRHASVATPAAVSVASSAASSAANLPSSAPPPAAPATATAATATASSATASARVTPHASASSIAAVTAVAAPNVGEIVGENNVLAKSGPSDSFLPLLASMQKCVGFRRCCISQFSFCKSMHQACFSSGHVHSNQLRIGARNWYHMHNQCLVWLCLNAE
jgi:hypothetical protein